jgi:hypothetical protein
LEGKKDSWEWKNKEGVEKYSSFYPYFAEIPKIH